MVGEALSITTTREDGLGRFSARYGRGGPWTLSSGSRRPNVDDRIDSIDGAVSTSLVDDTSTGITKPLSRVSAGSMSCWRILPLRHPARARSGGLDTLSDICTRIEYRRSENSGAYIHASYHGLPTVVSQLMRFSNRTATAISLGR